MNLELCPCCKVYEIKRPEQVCQCCGFSDCQICYKCCGEKIIKEVKENNGKLAWMTVYSFGSLDVWRRGDSSEFRFRVGSENCIIDLTRADSLVQALNFAVAKARAERNTVG